MCRAWGGVTCTARYFCNVFSPKGLVVTTPPLKMTPKER